MCVLQRRSIKCDGDNIIGTLDDARRMVPQAHKFIKNYALEVYYSSIAWLPQTSLLKQRYPMLNGPRIPVGLSKNWAACEQQFQCEGVVYGVAFSPDGSRIVSGSDDWTVRIWNVATGESEKELKGHSDWVRSVAFSPDGSRIVSGSMDETVQNCNTTFHPAIVKPLHIPSPLTLQSSPTHP